MAVMGRRAGEYIAVVGNVRKTPSPRPPYELWVLVADFSLSMPPEALAHRATSTLGGAAKRVEKRLPTKCLIGGGECLAKRAKFRRKLRLDDPNGLLRRM